MKMPGEKHYWEMIIPLFLQTLVFLLTQFSFENPSTFYIQAESQVRATSSFNPYGGQIQFVLFTRSFPPANIVPGDKDSFENSGYNCSNPTKIIIPGYFSSIQDQVFILNKNAYFKTDDDYNIIGMDWSRFNEGFYIIARVNAINVGYVLADFLRFLVQDCGVDPSDIHIIGHSLGAHIAGIGASQLRNYSIGRITGLDPASPGFLYSRSEYFLDSDDADLVDVIHTFTRVLSLTKPFGHVDFYPNGGLVQPGCPDIHDIWRLAESMLCNHGRAYEYFAESILNKKAFRSKRCPNLQSAVEETCLEKSDVYMGQAETYTNGLYYLETNSISPYSITDYEEGNETEKVE